MQQTGAKCIAKHVRVRKRTIILNIQQILAFTQLHLCCMYANISFRLTTLSADRRGEGRRAKTSRRTASHIYIMTDRNILIRTGAKRQYLSDAYERVLERSDFLTRGFHQSSKSNSDSPELFRQYVYTQDICSATPRLSYKRNFPTHNNRQRQILLQIESSCSRVKRYQLMQLTHVKYHICYHAWQWQPYFTKSHLLPVTP